MVFMTERQKGKFSSLARWIKSLTPIFLSSFLLFVPSLLSANKSYVEPGSFLLTNTLAFEGLFHQLKPGWVAEQSSTGLNKRYRAQGNDERPWKSEWGQRLFSEGTARFSPDAYGRFLLEAQGEYADRFWRPVNIEHHLKQEGDAVTFREAEGRIEKENWHLHGFSGVAHANWAAKGDFFGLYPDAYPMRDYLGHSSYFGVYPDNWREDQYLNITRRHIPSGVEAEGRWAGLDGTVAYGDELAWGKQDAFYGRLGVPIASAKMTFVYKDEDVDYSVFDEDERNQAYALSLGAPFESGHRIDAGVLYNPFRVGKRYQVADEVDAGAGLLGSSVALSEKTSKKEDALAGRIRLQRYETLFDKLVIWSLDLTRAEILAGNKEEAQVSAQTDFFDVFKGAVRYTYRRPIEGPIPFLFEGTPDSIGAVAASPRGPESPFWVNWQNREAVFVVTTIQYDPTPGTNFFQYDPHSLALWNVNKEEDSSFTLALQHRMSDYRTTTDRQYFHDENGDVVWESAAHTGAWPSDGPLHEVRVLGRGNWGSSDWILGVAGGQSPALLGLAYSNDTSREKPLTEYFSIEARWNRWPFSLWGHFGSGIWGPEENIHPYFGFAFDRLWGGGVSYNITKNTVWDLNYLGARQDDNLFVASDLGSFNEIRSILSHRFGFLFQFEGPARAGFHAK